MINYCRKFREWHRNLQERPARRFVSYFDIPPKSTILDISCGTGDVCAILNKYTSEHAFHGIDMSEKCIEKAKNNFPWGTFSVGRAEALAYDSNSFDLLISCMSLHHYDKPKEVFTEARRVLKKNGTLCVIDQIPLNRVMQVLLNWEGCDEPYHFERYYTKRDVEALAAEAGMKLEGAGRRAMQKAFVCSSLVSISVGQIRFLRFLIHEDSQCGSFFVIR